MANEIKLKKWNGSAWVQQYPEVRHTDIVSSGTPSSSTFLRGDGQWASVEDSGNQFVNITGDTMTGNLRIESGSFASLILDRGTTGSGSVVQFENNNGIIGGIGAYGDDGLQFRTSDGTQMVLDSNNRVGIGTTFPTKELDVNGNMIISGDNRHLTFGTPGGGSSTGGRFFSIEGNTDSSGEGSGRIFFTEHNSSTGAMDNYGMSIGYRGGDSNITGASGNNWTGLGQILNGQWGMWGHNNNATGALIMSGDRAATFIDFHSNELRNVNIANARYFDTYRRDTIDTASEDFNDFTTSGTYAVNNWSQSGDVVANGPTNTAAGNAYGWGMLRVTNFQSTTGTGNGYIVQEYIPHVSDTHYVRFQWNGTWTSWRAAWGSDNDGAGSGVDADLLDGQHGSYYTGYTDTAISNLIASAPGTLDTLNELAAAINDDASFASTITTQLTGKAKRIDLTNQVQLSSYRKSVIALCNVDNSQISRNSWSGGTIFFHRTNGLHAPVTAQITMEKRYNTTGANYTAVVMSGDSFGDNIQYVTFDYNGNTYGGIEFFFSNAELAQVYFIGESNFDIFGLDYYNTQTSTVLNTEVNNSISTSNMTAETDFFFNNQKIFHSGNDGSTSGLDAQYLQGIPVGSFLRSDAADTASGDITFTGNIVADGQIRSNSTDNNIAPINVKSDAEAQAIHIEEPGAGNSESWQIGVNGDGDLNFYNSGSSTPTIQFYDSNSVFFPENVTMKRLQGTSQQDRTKLRVWSGGTYGMGMHSGFTFGGLNDYAMTFQMNDDNDRGFWWGDSVHTTAQGAMALTTAGQLTVADKIRVGYGQADTTTPANYALDANGDIQISNSNPVLRLNDTGTTTGDAYIDYQAGTSLKIHAGGDAITFIAGNSEKARITAGNGFLGIGTTNPQASLHIVETSAGVDLAKFRNDGDTGDVTIKTSGEVGIIKGGAGDQLQLSANGTDNNGIRITTVGNVGIGETSVDTQLHISDPNGPVIKLEDPGTVAWRIGTSGTDLRISHNSDTVATSVLNIDNTGNIGVGTQSPAYAVDVAGDVNVTGNFKVNGTNIATGTAAEPEWEYVTKVTGSSSMNYASMVPADYEYKFVVELQTTGEDNSNPYIRINNESNQEYSYQYQSVTQTAETTETALNAGDALTSLIYTGADLSTYSNGGTSGSTIHRAEFIYSVSPYTTSPGAYTATIRGWAHTHWVSQSGTSYDGMVQSTFVGTRDNLFFTEHTRLDYIHSINSGGTDYHEMRVYRRPRK